MPSFFLLNLLELIYHSFLICYLEHLSCISIDLLINKKRFIHLFPIYIDFFALWLSKNNYLAIHTEILIDEIWRLECVLILQEQKGSGYLDEVRLENVNKFLELDYVHLLGILLIMIIISHNKKDWELNKWIKINIKIYYFLCTGKGKILFLLLITFLTPKVWGFPHQLMNYQLFRHQPGILQFSYNTDYLELALTPQIKNSTPWNCPWSDASWKFQVIICTFDLPVIRRDSDNPVLQVQ